MERKNKKCWNCGNYKAYYTKGLCHFDKLDYGLCRKKKETVDKHSQCEFWRNNYTVRFWREDIAKKNLTGILDAIIEIRQILFEEKEENECNPQKITIFQRTVYGFYKKGQVSTCPFFGGRFSSFIKKFLEKNNLT